MTNRIAISMGDPAGVGPELCLRMLLDEDVLNTCHPVVFGDWSVLCDVAHQLGEPWIDLIHRLQPTSPSDISVRLDQLGERGPTVVDLQQCRSGDVQAGQISATTGAASFAYLTAAIHATMNKQTDALVTAPIHKEAFHAAGVPFPGHTELLADLTGCERYCMMLTSELLTCSLVTTHIGLADVAHQICSDRILEVIRLTHEHFQARLGRPPKLGVLGLNPHAGENGLFGAGEEQQEIEPAIQSALNAGMDVQGPLAPDTAFLPSRRAEFDAYVCMYHDQGLIPLKTLAFDSAINVTLGLPIRRSSVDHGTALDIAWKGLADSTSFRNAIAWGCEQHALTPPSKHHPGRSSTGGPKSRPNKALPNSHLPSPN